jgi:hypothetical protein
MDESSYCNSDDIIEIKYALISIGLRSFYENIEGLYAFTTEGENAISNITFVEVDYRWQLNTAIRFDTATRKWKRDEDQHIFLTDEMRPRVMAMAFGIAETARHYRIGDYGGII